MSPSVVRFAGPAILAAAILGSLAVACGASDAQRPRPGQLGASASGGNNAANVAAQATEPRGMSATGEGPQTGTIPDPIGTAFRSAKSAPPSGAASGAASGTGTSSAPAATATAGDEEEQNAPTTISARHVLVQWLGSERAGKSVLRSREQARTLAEQVLVRAKAGEDLGRLAVEYSDEPGAGTRGGSLGRFTRGQMVPAFDAVVFKLKVGAISGIVETPFGFHVIQRTQ